MWTLLVTEMCTVLYLQCYVVNITVCMIGDGGNAKLYCTVAMHAGIIFYISFLNHLYNSFLVASITICAKY